MNYNAGIATVTAFLAFSLIVFSVTSCQSADSSSQQNFMIDSVEYSVPPLWLSYKIDSTDIAIPAKLVRLPDQLTFESYRIYVRPVVRDAFVAMAQAAKKDSIDLLVDSGFRSESFQRRIIKRRLHEGMPIDSILTMVAPPGYSEHHTGRALDLVPSEALFAKTDAYLWLRQKASDFHFYESLPEGNPDSLSWEPWHWVYRPE